MKRKNLRRAVTTTKRIVKREKKYRFNKVILQYNFFAPLKCKIIWTVNGGEASHWSRFLICLISSLHRECFFRVIMITCAGSRFRLKPISGPVQTEDFNARNAPYCICQRRWVDFSGIFTSQKPKIRLPCLFKWVLALTTCLELSRLMQI